MQAKLKAQLRRERNIKLASVGLTIFVPLVILLTVDHLLVSFVLAFVLNYLLAPIVDILERRGLPRQTAILIPFFAAGLLIAFGVYEILPLVAGQAKTLEVRLPGYQADLMNLLSNTEQRFKGVFKVYEINFSNSINSWMINKTAAWSSAVPSLVSGSLTVLLLTPILAYFMLQDGRQISRRILSMVPNGVFETALNLHHQLNDQMGGFIRARFLEAAIVGFVVWLGLQISGFPYASLLGLFAAITNLIPYIGPLIGAVPALAIALISPDVGLGTSMTWSLVVVSSVYFLAQLIDVIFVIPLVVARIVNLHPVTVIIVIIIGSQMMGILGMVISIPVASAMKLIFRSCYDLLMDYRAT